MEVCAGGGYVGMAQLVANSVQRDTIVQEPCAEAMAQGVKAEA